MLLAKTCRNVLCYIVRVETCLDRWPGSYRHTGTQSGIQTGSRMCVCLMLLLVSFRKKSSLLLSAKATTGTGASWDRATSDRLWCWQQGKQRQQRIRRSFLLRTGSLLLLLVIVHSLSLPLFRSVFLTLVVCPLLFPVLVDTYRPTTHNFAFLPWWSLWWETKVETSDDAVDKKWLREHQPYLSVRQQHHK